MSHRIATKPVFVLAFFRKFLPSLGLFLTTGVALAQKPVGIDVSHYQLTINWTSVKSAGIAFAWAKATDGATSSVAFPPSTSTT